MLGLHVGTNEREGGEQHRQVIGEADAEDEIGNDIDGRDEIDERGEQDTLCPERRRRSKAQ